MRSCGRCSISSKNWLRDTGQPSRREDPKKISSVLTIFSTGRSERADLNESIRRIDMQKVTHEPRREERNMDKRLSLEEIDRRNSKVMIPKWCIDGNGGSIEELETIFITREDGSKVSLANAVYADLEWLHASQLRHSKRLETWGVVK
jgi:hypothetical protein